MARGAFRTMVLLDPVAFLSVKTKTMSVIPGIASIAPDPYVAG